MNREEMKRMLRGCDKKLSLEVADRIKVAVMTYIRKDIEENGKSELPSYDRTCDDASFDLGEE